MDMEEKSHETIDKIIIELEDFNKRQFDITLNRDFEKTRYNVWKKKASEKLRKYIKKEYVDKFDNIIGFLNTGLPFNTRLSNEAKLRIAFLSSLKKDIGKYSEDILVTKKYEEKKKIKNSEKRKIPTLKNIFIIHGHDETNKLKLKDLFKDQWGLEPIILSYKAGEGRTLIEKFEQEAKEAGYAIALFTPDDLIEVDEKGHKYTQARPNVIFELGWFFGRLGRKNTCIIFKKGTKIHSDLDGISRIEFNDSVEEKVIEIERELKAAGLI